MQGVGYVMAARDSRGRMSALMFLSLRVLSASGAVVNGFALTYGLARTLDIQLFALFTFVGNLGVALWLFDLGLARVLYIRLRAAHLAETLNQNRLLRHQSGAIVTLYLALVGAGSLGALALGTRFHCGGNLSLFFVFCALNLPWFALRQISFAVDRFVGFECHEAIRRLTHITIIVSLPFGLPLTTALLIGNALWAMLLASTTVMLCRAYGLQGGRPAEFFGGLILFLKDNRNDLLSSAGYVGSEFYSYTYPPLLIPIVYGLGSVAIGFDTAWKIFRGCNLLLAAACEVAVPWQTRAYAERNQSALIRTTIAAAGLSLVPALCICTILLFFGDHLFGFLLGDAVLIPRELTLLVAGLIMANWLQTLSNYALVYTGFFSPIARLALAMAALLSTAGIFDIVAHPGMVGFTLWYAVIYTFGAFAYLVLALRLPLQLRSTGVSKLVTAGGTSP